ASSEALYLSNGIIQLNEDSISLIIKWYLKELELYSTRTRNVINSIFLNEQINESFEKKVNFIKEFVLGDISTVGLWSAGDKTKIELRRIALNVENKILSRISNGQLTIDPLQIELFDDSSFFDDDSTNAINYIIKNIKSKVFNIIKYMYFQEIGLSYKQIAVLCNKSRERIRQIDNDFKFIKLPRIIHSFLSIHPDMHIVEKSKEVFIANLSGIGSHEDFEWPPNEAMLSLYWIYVLENSHYNLKNVVTKSHSYIEKIWNDKVNLVFLRKEIYEEYNFHGLLEFINNEILTFYLASYDFRLKELIRRFYKEEQKAMPQDYLLEMMTNMFNLAIVQLSEFDTNAYKSQIRKNEKENMLNIIIDIFHNAPEKHMRTKVIMAALKERGFDLSLINTLKILGTNKTVFSNVGQGLWAIRSNNSSVIDGSIRDMVILCLSQSDLPVHISVILKFVSDVRYISERSLVSNIRADVNRFEFFNCSYYGIKGKVYSPYWSEIPTYNPLITYKALNNTAFPLNLEDLARQLSERNGWPLEHMIYSLNKIRNNKS
ncbi:MAG: hypothetical protein ACK5XN_05810, partial [Bacteroidota bacterium]